MTDVGVLDLSAKPMATKPIAPSPTPSASSSGAGDPHDDRPLSHPNSDIPVRSASVSSDGHDTDSSTGTGTNKPKFPPLPPLGIPGMPHFMGMPGMNGGEHPENGLNGAKKGMDGKGSLESMASMFPQLAQAQAAGLMPPGFGVPGGLPTSPLGLPGSMGALPSMNSMGTLGGMGGLSPLGLMDTSAISLSSPITQYLQQKRRRSEARTAAGTTESSSTSSSPIHSEPNQLTISTTPPLPSSGSSTPVSSSAYSPTLAHPRSSAASLTASSFSQSIPTSMGHSLELEQAAKRLKTGDGGMDMSSSIEEKRDLAYWDRRRKNNEAAKRSRDARRAKEEEIALRAAFLEQENLKLRAQVAILKNETAKLHYMLYNRS